MFSWKVGNSKKLKTSQDFEHAKSQESRNENGGVEPHGARPELVKLVLRARLRGC